MTPEMAAPRDGLLVISDNADRARRLVRDLGASGPCHIHDLYDDGTPACRPGLIVSDIEALTSEAIVRLRRLLGTVRGDGVPYIFLVRGNAARAEAQARLLGASSTVAAGVAVRTLAAAMAGPNPTTIRSVPSAERQAGTARRFLADVFVQGRPLTPTVIDTGTGIVAHAVREVGIRDWVIAVRRFDDATHQHCLLVAGLAAAFAGGLGLATADRHRLTKAALLHDVGKIHVPAEILNKPGRLTEAETAVMRTHPALGHALLANGGFEQELLAVVRSHHEMLDGSGYPDGLLGGQISDLVRLVTVCDIYGALIERRPYREPMASAKAYLVLEGMVGRLDGPLVRAFHPVASAFGGEGG